MTREQLDEEKIDALRRWAEGLALDQRGEMRAAARAILLLVEELERLHVELWHARQATAAPAPSAAAVEEPEPRSTLRSTLAARVREAARRPQ